MKGKIIAEFILIDDDPINNMICEQVIQESLPEAAVLCFTDPETGLSHIQSVGKDTPANNVIIFLDINMPTLSGWEVLDKFKALPPAVKQRLTIFMLSSSVDPRDKQRASENSFVAGYIEKPLTIMQVKRTLAEAGKPV